jgi:hypothetical protein
MTDAELDDFLAVMERRFEDQMRRLLTLVMQESDTHAPPDKFIAQERAAFHEWKAETRRLVRAAVRT